MAIKVEFIMYGENFPAQEIASLLQMRNAVIETKDTTYFAGQNQDWEITTDCTFLMYSTEYTHMGKVDPPIQTIYNSLQTKVAQLQIFIQKYRLKTKICITADLHENPMISIPHSLIQLVSLLNAELQFDAYISPLKCLFSKNTKKAGKTYSITRT